MLQNPKFLQPSSQLVHPQTASTPLPFPQLHNISSPSFPILKQFKISRRELTMSGNTSFLLLLAFQALERLYPSTAQAEENPPDNNNSPQELNQTNAEVEQNPAENNNQDESFQTNAQVEENPAENNNRDEFSQTNAKIEENPADNNNLQTQPEENSPGNNIQQEELNVNKPSFNCSSRVPTKRAFLDTAIDGEPVGRIVIGLYGNDVPSGAERFSSIVSGAAGISYRRKEFIKIMPNYVQHGGLRSYGVDAEVARRSGSNMAMEDLKAEWERAYEKCPGVKNLAGTVSMIVRDPSKPPPKPKLVARNGKLEIDEEEVGTDPNGTEFVISIKDSPELDSSALVVGKVLEGMEVVKRIGQVKTVQENSSSPYFRVAKLIGDKRAVVAERGFNRPYSKVVITNCGLLN